MGFAAGGRAGEVGRKVGEPFHAEVMPHQTYVKKKPTAGCFTTNELYVCVEMLLQQTTALNHTRTP